MTRRHALLLPALLASIALALAGCGGGGGDSSSGGNGGDGGSASVTGNAAAGSDIFATNCAACHGDMGQGGVGPNLQASAKAEDVEAVAEQVANGGGSMPPFSGKLSDQQIADVSAYVTEELAPKA